MDDRVRSLDGFGGGRVGDANIAEARSRRALLHGLDGWLLLLLLGQSAGWGFAGDGGSASGR